MNKKKLFAGVILFFCFNTMADSNYKAESLSLGEYQVETSAVIELLKDLQKNATIKECNISIKDFGNNTYLLEVSPIDKFHDYRSFVIHHGGFIDHLNDQSIYQKKFPGQVIRYEYVQETGNEVQIKNILQLQKDYLSQSRYGSRLISLIKIYLEKLGENLNGSDPLNWKEVYDQSVICVTDIKTIELKEPGHIVKVEPLNKSDKIFEGKISVGFD